MSRKEAVCNERRAEPSLNELLGDFAMQLLMRRDGVTESDIRALLCEVKDARAAALGGTRASGHLLPGPHCREDDALACPQDLV